MGYAYSRVDIGTSALLLNVSLEATVLWVTAFLVLRYRASSRSLEDREERLRALVATAVDGVMIIDAAGTVQEYNPACARLFGYGADEVVGNNAKMLMPPPTGRSTTSIWGVTAPLESNASSALAARWRAGARTAPPFRWGRFPVQRPGSATSICPGGRSRTGSIPRTNGARAGSRALIT